MNRQDRIIEDINFSLNILRNRSLQMNKILKGDLETLQSSVDKTKFLTIELKRLEGKIEGQRINWFLFFLIGLVLIIFIIMVIFIRCT